MEANKKNNLFVERDFQAMLLLCDSKNQDISEKEKRLLIWFYTYYQRILSILIAIRILIGNEQLIDKITIEVMFDEFERQLNIWINEIPEVIHQLLEDDSQLIYEYLQLFLGDSAICLVHAIQDIKSKYKNGNKFDKTNILDWNNAIEEIPKEWLRILSFQFHKTK